MRIVIRIGGSVIASPVNEPLLSKYVEILKKLNASGHEVAVVVGGGNLAREFINLTKKMGLDEEAQDRIAISVSRLFAQVLTEKLGGLSCGEVPATLEKAADCLAKKGIVVMGGLRPGMTTDTVAVLMVKKTNSELLIKASNQEGVYDKDPAKFPRAKKLDHIDREGLSAVLNKTKHEAGIHQIIDPEAAKMLTNLRVRLMVVNGFDPENILKAIVGESVGTVISF